MFFLFVLPHTASATITYFGSASTPADNGTNTTDPTAVTPPASMQSGDLVILFAEARANVTPAMSATGGQTWNALTTTHNGTTTTTRMFWATFNGTWSANPSVSFGSTTNNTVVMHVFRGSSTSTIWAIDASESAASYSAPSSPYTVTILGITTNSNNALIIASWGSQDDNTWGNLTTGWTVLGDAQYRNTSGSDTSLTFAYKIQATAGQSGSVSKDQLTLGGDAGTKHIVAFREASVYDVSLTNTASVGTSNLAGLNLYTDISFPVTVSDTNSGFWSTYPVLNLPSTASSTGLSNFVSSPILNLSSDASSSESSIFTSSALLDLPMSSLYQTDYAINLIEALLSLSSAASSETSGNFTSYPALDLFSNISSSESSALVTSSSLSLPAMSSILNSGVYVGSPLLSFNITSGFAGDRFLVGYADLILQSSLQSSSTALADFQANLLFLLIANDIESIVLTNIKQRTLMKGGLFDKGKKVLP